MFVPVFWADAQEWELDHVARVRGCTKHVSAQALHTRSSVSPCHVLGSGGPSGSEPLLGLPC